MAHSRNVPVRQETGREGTLIKRVREPGSGAEEGYKGVCTENEFGGRRRMHAVPFHADQGHLGDL